jgi:hypothetical protein
MSQQSKTAVPAAPAAKQTQTAVARVVESTPGKSLTPDTRQRLETSFERPLNSIRVHSDARAGRAATALGAEAFARGDDIVFAPGRYRPDTREGFRLLAHEVAHTLQPGGGGAQDDVISKPNESAERTADIAADHAVRGELAGIGPGGLDTRARIMRRAVCAEPPVNPAKLRTEETFKEQQPAEKPTVPPEPKPFDKRPKPPLRETTSQDARPERPAIAAPERPAEVRQTGPEPEEAPPPEELFAAEREEIDTEPETKPEAVAEAGKGPEGGAAGGPAGEAAAPNREQARARVDTAMARIRNASAITTGLANRPVQFAQGEDERSGDMANFFVGLARRHRAQQMGASFLARNAGQISRLISQAQSAAPAILAAAGQARRTATVAARGGQAALSESIAGAKANVLARGTSTTGRIGGREETGRGQAHSATETARSAVETTFTSTEAGVTPLEDAQRTRIEQAYTDGDQGYRDTGMAVGNDAMATARRYQRNWLSQRNGESDVLDGPIHDDRLEARAEAAIKVGEAYQTELENAANEEADKGFEGKPTDLETVGTSGEECRGTLRTQWEQADSGLADSGLTAEDSVTSTGQPYRNNATRSAAGVRRALDAQSGTQMGALTSYEAQQTESIDRDADIAVAALIDGAADAAERLTQPLTAFLQQAMATPAPEGRDLGMIQGELETVMAGVVSEVFTRFASGIDLSRGGVQRGGDAVAATIESLAAAGASQAASTEAEAVTSLEALLGQAVSALGQVVSGHVTNTAQSRQTAVLGLEQVLAGIETLFDTYGQNLTANFTQAAQGLDTGLRNELAKEEDVIEEEAQKAADQVQPRWKTVLKVLLVIAVVIVVALVVGPAVIGFVGAAAAGLGATAGAATVIGTIVGGAIVGAAAGATIQLGNNIIDGKENLLEGVGTAAVVGAISGAFGGLGSAVAGSVGGSLGAVGQVVLRGGIELAFDVGGGIIADLAVGNPITLEGVLMGAAIGLGVSVAGANLGRLGSVGRRAEGIQQGFMAAGEALGGGAARAVRGAAGLPPIETGAPPRVDVEEPPATREPAEPPRTEVGEPAPAARPGEEAAEAPAPRPEEPEPPAPRAEPEPEAPAPRPEEPEPVPRPAAEEPPAPRPEEAEAMGADEHGGVARDTTPDGEHEVSVTPDGRLIRCSDQCAVMRLEFDAELQARPDLQQKLDDIEATGRSDPEGASSRGADLEERLRSVREISEMSDADLKAAIEANPKGTGDLADDLRFERYRRGGGELEFDDWLSVSRGGRSGGPNHQKIQQELVETAPVGSDVDVEVKVETPNGDRFADAYWSNGPDGKPVYHQIGGRNPSRGDPIIREREAIRDIRRALGEDVDIWFWDKANPGAPPLKNPDLDPRYRDFF